MARLITCVLATTKFFSPTWASACAPPNVGFNPGSARLGANDWREIRYALEGYRPGSPVRFLLTTNGYESGPAARVIRLARRRAEAVRAALIRSGVPARYVAIDSASIVRAATQPRGSVPTVWIETVDASSGCGG